MCKYFISTVLFLFSKMLFAYDYQHFLFQPATTVTVEAQNTSRINVDKGGEITVTLKNGPNGYRMGKVLWADCSTGVRKTAVRQDKTAWVIVPDQFYVDGVKVNLKIKESNGWGKPNQPIPPGYQMLVAQQAKISEDRFHDCWKAGNNTNVDFYWKDAQITITIPAQTVFPGKRTLNIPFYYGYEENKYTDNDPHPAFNIPSLLLSNSSEGQIKLEIEGASICTFKTNGNNLSELKTVNNVELNLSHGVMSAREMDGNQTRYQSVSIICPRGTSITTALVGTNYISGNGDNFTECGTGGLCELTFDDGKSNKTFTVDGQKDIYFKSTYHVKNKSQVVEGPFRGSGMLKITIN